MSDERASVGIIGGSGLYEMDGLRDAREVLSTPRSASLRMLHRLGTLEGFEVAFLARQARGHRLLPSELNYRANLWAMKKLGVERILSVSAVGSLKERVRARCTWSFPTSSSTARSAAPRPSSATASWRHVCFADPFCRASFRGLAEACREAGATVHAGGTYVCMEGPQFSTRAESHLYRSWGMDVIGMTNLQEAKLAREAEICYATLAMVTDYDCWHPDHDAVTVEQVISVLTQNAARAKAVLKAAVRRLDRAPRSCECASALAHALMTPAALVPERTKRDLAPIIGRYIR